MLSQNPVGVVAVVMVVGSVLGVLLSLLVRGAEGLGSVLGLAFNCWVAWHLLQGSALARWFSVLSLGLPGIGGIIGGVMALSHNAGLGVLLFIVGVIIDVPQYSATPQRIDGTMALPGSYWTRDDTD